MYDRMNRIIIIITILIIISVAWYYHQQTDKKERKQIQTIKNSPFIYEQWWGFGWRPWW
jgi:lipopolysaccharide export system protein LptC